jgi:tetratricopeptide (TPR) repeat protein
MNLARDHIAIKLTAAALAFLATFAAVRAIDGGRPSVGIDGGSGDLSDGLRPSATTAQRIEALEAQVRQRPSDPQGHADLGRAYLTRFGETEDPGFYPKAQHAFETAVSLDSNYPSAVAGMAQLELSRHRFRSGLALAERARRLNPSTVQIDGLITDAQVELGRYGAAARTLQHYVDRRPELGSYARISYLRELHGDMSGAVRGMELAASAAGERSGNSVYATTLLGKLRADQGDYTTAERLYRQVLMLKPGYPDAMLGLAAIEFGRGHTEAGLDLFRDVQRRVAAPDHAILLGEAEEAAGHPAAASRAYDAARAAFDGLEAQGANTATERAVFEASHGDAARAVELGRRAWRYTPSVRAADAYSWALSAAGEHRAALRFSARAMRLGSRDPIFRYHAGMVALRADRPGRAHAFLAQLVAESPEFSPLYGPRARRVLNALALGTDPVRDHARIRG